MNYGFKFGCSSVCMTVLRFENARHHPGRGVNKCTDQTRTIEPLVCMPLFCHSVGVRDTTSASNAVPKYTRIQYPMCITGRKKYVHLTSTHVTSW